MTRRRNLAIDNNKPDTSEYVECFPTSARHLALGSLTLGEYQWVNCTYAISGKIMLGPAQAGRLGKHDGWDIRQQQTSGSLRALGFKSIGG